MALQCLYEEYACDMLSYQKMKKHLGRKEQLNMFARRLDCLGI